MKIGFIDYYLDEWHANNYPQMLKDISNGEIEVAFAYGQIASPITGKTSEEWCQEYGIELCESIEKVVEKSDALVVLSPDNCEKHEELAQLPLKSGKKTYIDKVFAPDKKSAVSMFTLGEKHNTPCYSTSALRFAAEYQPFKDKEIKSMCTWGSNDINTYSIHQLEPVLMLMKGSVKRVLALTHGTWANILLEWEDGRTASMVCTGGVVPFEANIGMDDSCENIKVESAFFDVFIENLIHFFRTGEIPVSHEETISIMAVREAVLKAAETPGEWISVE